MIHSRRSFLKHLGLGAAALTLSTGDSRAASDRPPNILFLISDEHNASVMGAADNALVKTPNLDSLAETGILFENCYCNSPLCVPSRMTITAGKYISRTGAWSNDTWLPSDDYPSLARVLKAAGYDALLCGKMHYDATRRYGFEDVGGNFNAHFKSGRGGRRKADDLTPKPGLSNRFDDFHPGGDSKILSHDRKVTKGVLGFFSKRKADDKPFFLIAGYLAPHFPLIVPEEYWEPYKGKVAMPEIPEGHLASQPRNYQHLRIGFDMEDVPADIVRKGRELYYGLTQWFDDEVGKVLAALKDSQVADNTIVIYTTDHGENMGEHGLWWKNCVYDSAARIPLMVSWPARWAGGQRRSQVCSMVDVVQTVVELARTTCPEDWDGDSLVPVLEDPKAEWKDSALTEYYAHNIASGYVMLRQGKYKYVYHTAADADHPAERELYDLEADPGEFTNLAAKADYTDRVAAMHAALVEELGEDPEESEKRCRADYAKGYGRKQPLRKAKRKRKA